jgi:hypothetical protein
MTSEFGDLVSRSYGRSRDDGSDFEQQPQNPLDLPAEWALSRQHLAHRISAMALFEYREHHLIPSQEVGSGRPFLEALRQG